VFPDVRLQDPSAVSIKVRDGVVILAGQLEDQDLLPAGVRMVTAIDGVVAATDKLSAGRPS
jgi:osmotically-inducible protein OsmY